MWRVLPTDNIFTLEASFWGPNIGPIKDNHFRTSDYHSIGYKLCQAVLIYAKIECTSLKTYLEAKTEEQEEEEKQEASKTSTREPPTNSKSHSQPPVFKQNNIVYVEKINVNGVTKASDKVKAEQPDFNSCVRFNDLTSYYESFDKISHATGAWAKFKKPGLKVKSTREPEPKPSRPPIFDDIPKIQNVLRSFDTSNLLEEFRQWNLNDSDNDASSESGSGDTTSGSESNLDEKELFKVLPGSHKHRKKRPKRSKTKKYFSLRSQRQNSKGEKSSKKLSTIQKTISRSESYRRVKTNLNKVNASSTAYMSNLCKSSNNIQDNTLNLGDNSLNASR